jgi:hypothetical protein
MNLGRQKDNTEIKEYWAQYVAQFDLLGKISITDLLPERTVDDIQFSGSYDDDVKTLRSCLDPQGANRAMARFRQWLSRKRNKKTSITLESYTLEQLKKLAAASGFEADSYDMMIRYLIETPHDFSEASKAMHSLPIETSRVQKGRIMLDILKAKDIVAYECLVALIEESCCKH